MDALTLLSLAALAGGIWIFLRALRQFDCPGFLDHRMGRAVSGAIIGGVLVGIGLLGLAVRLLFLMLFGD